MELRHLRYFVAVAEEKNFSRAAERLLMAQPPLSQAIRQLERELGVALLTRSTRKVDLTPAGEVFLTRARRILADADDAAAQAARVAAGEEGQLTLGFAGSATYSLLPYLVRELRSELPKVRFELRGELLTPPLAQALADHRVDVAFLRPRCRTRPWTCGCCNANGSSPPSPRTTNWP